MQRRSKYHLGTTCSIPEKGNSKRPRLIEKKDKEVSKECHTSIIKLTLEFKGVCDYKFKQMSFSSIEYHKKVIKLNSIKKLKEIVNDNSDFETKSNETYQKEFFLKDDKKIRF